MEPLELIIVLLCVLLGLGRGADLAFATDAATGLCTAGAVWWRYLALGAVVLAAVLAGRSRPLPRSRCAAAARRQACWPLPGQCVCWLPVQHSLCWPPVR